MNKKIILCMLVILISITPISITPILALSLGDVSNSASNFLSNIFKSFFSFFSVSTSISCDDCDTDSCGCQVSNCDLGDVLIYKGSGCPGFPIYDKEFSESGMIIWIPGAEGAYSFIVACADDMSQTDCSSITIGGGITTTTQPGVTTTTQSVTTTTQPGVTTTTQSATTTTTPFGQDLEMSFISCSENECTINIAKNTLDSQLVIFFELKEDISGKIYYTSNLNIEPGSTGEKKIVITRVRSCPEDTEVTFLILTYRQTNLGYILHMLRGDTFTC